MLIPLYAFLLVTLIGEKANLPDVCQGIRQEVTPCSIALTIWDVTLAYTSRLSVAVLSVLGIEVVSSTLVFRGHGKFVACRGPVLV